jgi:phosphoglycolate phosphatase
LYRLAIFDFDGTLVDSAPGMLEIMRTVVSEFDLGADVAAKWGRLIGIPLVGMMQDLFPDKPATFQCALAERFRALYDHAAVDNCPLVPRLPEVLASISSAGMLMSIASSKPRALVEIVLDYHGISHYFSLVVGFEDVAFHKPHPQSVTQTVEILKVPIDAVVVIGDSTFDLDMARNAGVDAVGVTTGIHTQQMLEKSSPVSVVNSLHEALPFILNGRPPQAS